MLAVPLDIPEAVGADARASVNRYPVGDDRAAIDRDRRVQVTRGADLDTGAQHAVRPDDGAVTDDRTLADDRIWPDCDVPPQSHPGPDDRRRVHARLGSGCAMK